jgi:uncharacterized membrane protein YhaH (DUF805 family)
MDGGVEDWRRLFMTAGGRSGRSQTWIAVGVLFFTSLIYEAIAGPTLKLLTFWIVYPALLASATCVISKRLHDRGRSGWWAALVLFALSLTWPTPRGGWAVAAFPVMVWALVELGVLPGEQGTNRFGPSPLAPPSAWPAESGAGGEA